MLSKSEIFKTAHRKARIHQDQIGKSDIPYKRSFKLGLKSAYQEIRRENDHAKTLYSTWRKLRTTASSARSYFLEGLSDGSTIASAVLKEEQAEKEYQTYIGPILAI